MISQLPCDQRWIHRLRALDLRRAENCNRPGLDEVANKDALLIQINNTIGTRQIRPKTVDSHEVFQTLFCYEDDDEEMVRHRLLSANLVGPAGFVSMEDGEAIEVVQKATRSASGSARGTHAVIEMGGRGQVKDETHRVTESPIRGFWSYWAELMGVEAPDGIR